MLFTDLETASRHIESCSVVIGNFDGVHVGHRELLKAAREHSDGAIVVLTFNPHPVQFFRGGRTPFLLTSIEERANLLHAAGAQHVVSVPFDAEFASLSDEEFVRDVLLNSLQANAVLVGRNFVFGKGRIGNYDRLVEMGARLGFDAIGLDLVQCEGERASSTRIRGAISAGDLALANRLLGRRYSISGPVIHGEARGRTLGFPTANVSVERDRILPPTGIYATYATVSGTTFEGATYVGTKPTFGFSGLVVETHVLDAPRPFDIYGELLTVEFAQRIRGDAAFTTPEELVRKMNEDIEQIRAYFTKQG